MAIPRRPYTQDKKIQQKLYEVIKLPPRPKPFDCTLYEYYDKPNLAGIPEVPHPVRSLYLFQVRWMFTTDIRRDSFYLHTGETDYFLWLVTEDPDGYGTAFFPAASVPIKDVSEYQAAVYLVIEFWIKEKGWLELEKFHSINVECGFSVPQIQAIAREVWSDDSEEESHN